MYTIYADDKLLYSPIDVEDGYVVFSPKVTVEINKCGSAEFTVPPSNPSYDSYNKLKSAVTVKRDGKLIFRGRVLHDEKDFYKQKQVYCEGELSYLLDTIQRPYNFKGKLYNFFMQLLNNHTSYVGSEKQYLPGEITAVDDPFNSDVEIKNENYSDTFTELMNEVVDPIDGMIEITHEEDSPMSINILKKTDRVSSQVIEFGVNLLDLTEYINAEDVFTCLIPLGEDTTDSEGNTTGKVTIKSVNGNKDYIEDETAVALFGKIYRTNTWDYVKDPNELLAKGREYLKKGIEMAVTLSIKAIDLHLINVDTDAIEVGELVRVVSLPHGLDKYFLCTKIVYDITNPDQSEFIFGSDFRALTDRQVSDIKMVQNANNSVYNIAHSANGNANGANNRVDEIERVISDIDIDIVYKVKGDVANKASLPSTGMKVGDCYNTLDTDANYVWDGFKWDKLSGNATGGITEETDPTVPAWAKQPTKPSYSYSEIKDTPTITELNHNIECGYVNVALTNAVTGGYMGVQKVKPTHKFGDGATRIVSPRTSSYDTVKCTYSGVNTTDGSFNIYVFGAGKFTIRVDYLLIENK